MFSSALISNRGEISLRIPRACRVMGLLKIAVSPEADRDAARFRHGDASLCIGPSAAVKREADPAAMQLAAAPDFMAGGVDFHWLQQKLISGRLS
jgi:acetyl-CoA carboxylase biotin carboxylase subunit